MEKIGVVIVTYNRCEKLKKAIESFEQQTFIPKYMIIVDNNSNDETSNYLKKWEDRESIFDKIVIRTNENLGGSGGFHIGLEHALKLDADWVWVSDDDAFPEQNVLEIAGKYISNHKSEKNNISALCSSVFDGGKIDISHRKNVEKALLTIKFQSVDVKEYSKKEFQIQGFSYVGAIINKEKMEKVGTTRNDFFIWHDDAEHSIRLSKVGKIICIPEMIVHHDTAVTRTTSELGWKVYYGIRNKIVLLKKYFPQRYWIWFCVVEKMRIVGRILIRKNVYYNKIINQAISDAIKGKMGKNKIYGPGWKLE